MHTVDPELEAYDPAGQGSHVDSAVACVLLENFPATHNVHAVELPALHVPAGHVCCCVEPISVLFKDDVEHASPAAKHPGAQYKKDCEAIWPGSDGVHEMPAEVLYVPGEHAMHVLEDEGLYDPAGHSMH